MSPPVSGRSALLLLLASIVLPFAPALAQQDPFASHIRPTDPLTPEQELKTFTVPDGFEVQLVAADPDIAKPMNLAFDDRGRLWVSESLEYPIAAPVGQPGRDKIKILEDTDGDGRADKITTFADGLNIPIGLYPYKNGVIVYSIPYIWHLEDTDGDDKADKRTKLYGPMGYERDTHGMNNGFRRGFDGWLYACHGFNNETTVRGKDGHEIHMQSGNTYRMKLDGSRIEQFTWGQVNPFGMDIDPLGNLFTADCHTKPLYQLVRGGYYPSFGKPHDGLGFVPPMMEHLHGSTAIGGVAIYHGNQFPKEYHGNFFGGNVMTCRVNRNAPRIHGGTIVAEEKPDLMSTTDPWFRPVDLRVGPDGALYVADFYNRVIGHYEVPLNHKGRDRERGRIWKIVYKDANTATNPLTAPNLLTMDVDGLVRAMEHPSLHVRLAAQNRLVDKHGERSRGAVIKGIQSSKDENLRSHGLWVLARTGGLSDEQLALAALDPSRAVRVHTMKLLAEQDEWTSMDRIIALSGLSDRDGFVQRAAIDALGQHPHRSQIEPLIRFIRQVADDDPLVRHTARIALRNQLQAKSFEPKHVESLPLEDSRIVADVCLGVKNEASGDYLIGFLERFEVPQNDARQYIAHAARWIETPDAVVDLTKKQFGSDVDFQLSVLESVARAVDQRGSGKHPRLRSWALDLAQLALTINSQWNNVRATGVSNSENPWTLERRECSDGKNDQLLLGSLPRGERLTGRLRSDEFDCPERLSFFLAGHIGKPGDRLDARNSVRLVKAEDNSVLREVRPPRNDIAQKIEWELTEFRGSRVRFEAIDGDSRGSFAWLSFGRIEPEVAEWPTISPAQLEQRTAMILKVAGDLKLTELKSRVNELIKSHDTPLNILPKACLALDKLISNPWATPIGTIIGDSALSAPVRNSLRETIFSNDKDARATAFALAFQTAPSRLQQPLAQALCSTKPGGELLLSLAEQGKASPRMLRRTTIKQQLTKLAVDDAHARMEKVLAELPDQRIEINNLINATLRSYDAKKKDLERGAEVFKKTCAVCHQMGGKGEEIGPQLDGIALRGVERIVEDIIDPNRNVDVAFRVTTFATRGGKVITGLLKRTEGETLVIFDNQGKEIRLQKSEVEEQETSRMSLMPEELVKNIGQKDLWHLLGFLASRTIEHSNN